VAVARALANDPAVLLADEPTGNLDSATSVQIMALFQELYEQGKTVILVTHEPDIAAYAKGRIVLKDGKVLSLTDKEQGA
jgi:putative ABC transport system ATP-binding protein